MAFIEDNMHVFPEKAKSQLRHLGLFKDELNAAPPQPIWEYYAWATISDFGAEQFDKLQEMLTRLGQEQWELVTSFTTVQKLSIERVFIFKRPAMKENFNEQQQPTE